MIKVQFKSNYEKAFTEREYTYKDFDGVKVGDIVVVDTRSGYAIARVSQVDVFDFSFDLSQLKSIVKIIITKEEMDAKQKEIREKQEKMNAFVKEATRKVLLERLKQFNDSKEYTDFLETLETDELEKLYNML